jgi:pilus assembly protein Flp/PilA
MKQLRGRQRLAFWLKDERGATAIEYGLIVALLAMALSVTIMTLGGDLKTVFTTISGALTGS